MFLKTPRRRRHIEQDTESAIETGHLYLSYGASRNTADGVILEVGQEIGGQWQNLWRGVALTEHILDNSSDWFLGQSERQAAVKSMILYEYTDRSEGLPPNGIFGPWA